MQSFFIAESVGIFDVVENLLDERARVEVVRRDAEQIAFGGVVESKNVRIGFIAGQNAVAVVADFVEESSDFVVHANPAVTISRNVLYKLLKFLLHEVTCIRFDGKSRNHCSCNFFVIPGACKFVIGKRNDF